MARWARARALGSGVGATLGTAVVFVTAMAGGALLHLDAPAVKRAGLARLNRVLGSVLAGHIVVDRVAGWGPDGVDGVDAHVEDPEGHTVLRVSGVSAQVATEDLLRSLASGGDMRVDIEDLAIASADVDVDADDDGTLWLARAFASPPTTQPPPPGSSGGPGLRLTLARVRLAHVAVHGRPPGAPVVDADIDGALARFEVTPQGLSLEVEHAGLVARGLPEGVTTHGTLDGRLAQPAPDGSDRYARVSWRGAFGELAATAAATYDAGRVDAVVDVPATRAECVRALWATCPFVEPTAAHVEAHGTLPHLLLAARATVGRGTLALAGPVTVDDGVRASLHLDATSIDAHEVASGAPPSDLSAAAEILLDSTAQGRVGTVVALDFAGGTLDGTPLPRATIDAELQREESGALRADARVAVREPGAPTTATLHLSPGAHGLTLAFDAQVDVPRLDGVARLGPVAHGSARAHAHGNLDLGASRVDAHVEASLLALEAGAARLGDASLRAHASGPLTAPWLDVDLGGHALRAGPLRFETLHAEVHGPPTAAPVKVSLHGHGADFRAQATVVLQGGGGALRDLRVAMDRNGESAQASAAVVRVGGRETSVEDLVIDGLGAHVRATARVSPGALAVQARSRDIDLARVGKLLGVERLAGNLSFDVDASVRGESAQGRVALDLAQGAVGDWRDAQAHVEATMDGRRATGHATAALGGIGTVDVTTKSLELGPGGPLQASAWRTAWGEGDVKAHVDLARLSACLPKGTIAVGNLAGSLDVDGRVARDSASDATPDVDVTASTSGLALVGSPVPWRIDGIDATVRAHVDGHSGMTALDASVNDPAGALITVAATSDAVPYAQVFTAAEPVKGALLAMPLRALVTLPAHDIARLPAFLGLEGLSGMLAATVDLSGSVEKPTVDARATVTQGKTDVTLLALPVDLALAAHYDGAHADASLAARAHGEQVLDASARADVVMADVLDGGDLAWKASARAKLSALPLQSIAALDDRQVRGKASGTFQLDGLHDDAHAEAALTLTDLQVGDVVCGPTTLQATAASSGVDAAARIAEADGYAETKAHLGAHWGRDLAPSLDPAQAQNVSFTAHNFRAAVLLPFVSQIFTELDGRIEASASVQLDPAAKTMKPQGTIALTGGVFELAAMGSELHDATAKITMTPDGVVRLENASARGLSGRVEAAATVRFQGKELSGASARVQVARKDALPLVFDGTQVGLFDGLIDVNVTRPAGALDVAVDIPTMRLQLPLASTHDVQTLGSIQGVEVGIGSAPASPGSQSVEQGDASAHLSAAPGNPIHVSVHLGSDVDVKRGADLDVRMDGRPEFLVGDTVTAKGQIRLVQGSLNVKGKTFNIEKGTVTFVDDPGNPQVILTASWNAPDGTIVYADFIGPLRTGKVTLRSEPSISNDRILGLLLYGTQDQQATASSSAAAPQLGAATGVAGAAASENVNRALGGVNNALESLGIGSQISTKLDTSQATPRPEVEVQIAKDLSFQIAWVLGVPPPGNNPDTTLFTLSWRFLRSWEADTTVGDAGTSIFDLVWQHRY